MSGNLTNRVALDKAITVQSVNGYSSVIITGSGPTNGTSAIRCAWLTNGASLIGFTLQNGATRTGASQTPTTSGGGVWCASSNAIVANCLIRSNAAIFGGGVFQGTINNSVLTGNKNSFGSGAGAYLSLLKSCTVVSNSAIGVASCILTNCIVYFNTPNASSCTFSYSCTTPLPSGNGNIDLPPQFIGDGVHLSSSSPCRSAGTNVVSGLDIDGQIWSNPPSIGADDWHAEPAIVSQPKLQVTSQPVGFTISVAATGEESLAYFWTRNGVPLVNDGHYKFADTPNLVANEIKPFDGGIYQVVVSNSFGMATSAVVQLVTHCVDAGGLAPVAPFTSWENAATNIQDAIGVSLPGEIVLVTNGVYATGGKAITGDLTNRVAITKAVLVTSVNGPATTIIEGTWDPATNGPLAVRSVWLTNNAVLNGFTIQRGATRVGGDSSGGGVWGASTQALVMNCWIATNAAASDGGGGFQATLDRCKLIGNFANKGGGAANGWVKNSLVAGNTAATLGGGSYECNLNNCTFVGNTAQSGGGVYGSSSTTRNSIIFGNNSLFIGSASAEYFGSAGNITYCCVYTPMGTFSGTGNISTFPQFTDQFHLAVTSPCRGTGNALYASDRDFDGEAWLGSPSIGCDEVIEANINGPLEVSAKMIWSEVAERQIAFLLATVNGRATRLEWDFGDSSRLTNSSLNPLHVWTNAGNYNATFTAYNSEITNGVSTNFPVHVVPLIAPTFLSVGLSGTNFTLNFLGQSNVNGSLERATNLTPPVAWQFVGSIYSASNLIQITDRKATNDARYYRVRIP